MIVQAMPYPAGESGPTADFSNAVFLLACCGSTIGTQNSVDESYHQEAVARSNDAQISSTKPTGFGPGSYRFDGNLDRVYVSHEADRNLGSDEFAIKGMFLIDSTWLTTRSFLVGKYQSSANQREYGLYYDGVNGVLEFLGSADGITATTLLSASWSPTGDTFYFIMVERSGDIFRLWVGDIGGTVTCLDEQTHAGYSFFASTALLSVGADSDSNNPLKGNASEVEVYTGAPWTRSNASWSTPTTRSPRSVAPATTPQPTFANVKLLVHGEGADGSTTFTDRSSGAKALTANGNVQNDTGVDLNGESILFDGTGDYITTPDHNDFDLSAGGDFCLEAWIKPNDSGVARTIFNKRPSSTATGYSLYRLSGNQLAFQTFTSGAATRNLVNQDATSTSGTTQHVVVSRQGTVLRLFVNGWMVDCQKSTSHDDNTQVFRIGRDGFSTARDWNGSMNWIRVVRGEHIYDSTFTPPTTLPTS